MDVHDLKWLYLIYLLLKITGHGLPGACLGLASSYLVSLSLAACVAVFLLIS